MTHLIGNAITPLTLSVNTARNAGRKIGYARVSTNDQNLDRQLDVLKQVGCDAIFCDKISGAKAGREGLDDAMAMLRAGDMLVVYKLDRLGRSVSHLAQLLEQFERDNIYFCSLTEGLDTSTPGGRMVYHIFAAVAQFTRDLIHENTMSGLEAARKRGRVGGRRFLLTPDDVIRAHIAIRDEGQSYEQVAKACGVSRITLQRALKRQGLR